ncbi:MAG: hypothetical protein AAGI22_04820 [Planctomycetota bacterium]
MSAAGDGQPTRRAPAAFHQVLIILFGTLFLASGDDSLEDRVEDALPEGERRERALEVVERMEDHAEEELRLFVRWHEGFYDMIEGGERAPEAIRSAVTELMDGANDFDRRSVDLIMELREQVEPDEWTGLFGD